MYGSVALSAGDVDEPIAKGKPYNVALGFSTGTVVALLFGWLIYTLIPMGQATDRDVNDSGLDYAYLF